MHLELALEQLTALAERMNEAEKEASNVDKLRDLAANIEGASQVRSFVQIKVGKESRATSQNVLSSTCILCTSEPFANMKEICRKWFRSAKTLQ